MTRKYDSLRQYLNTKIAVSGACWLWVAGQDGGGYGSTGYERAHRFVYKQLVGPIPKGMCILHSCANKNCVNPAHLRLGTHDDNMKDKRKLTDAQEQEIIKLYKAGIGQKRIAGIFYVSQAMISDIVTGRKKRVRGK